MNKQKVKAAMWAIFTGACVAFGTFLLEGTLDLLRGYGNNVAGGISASLVYIVKTFRV